MEIQTRDYGTVDIDESSIIGFDDGIIGFEAFHDYVLLNVCDEPSPFRCLQSVEDSGLAFILFDPFCVRPDYEVEISEDAAARLSIENSEDAVILAIAVVPEDIKKMCFNLKAPVIINAKINKGIQYVTDNGDYGVRHFLYDEMERSKKQGVCGGRAAV